MISHNIHRLTSTEVVTLQGLGLEVTLMPQGSTRGAAYFKRERAGTYGDGYFVLGRF